MRGTRAKRERRAGLRAGPAVRPELSEQLKSIVTQRLMKLKALAHFEANPDNTDDFSVAKRKRRLARNVELLERDHLNGNCSCYVGGPRTCIRSS